MFPPHCFSTHTELNEYLPQSSVQWPMASMMLNFSPESRLSWSSNARSFETMWYLDNTTEKVATSLIQGKKRYKFKISKYTSTICFRAYSGRISYAYILPNIYMSCSIQYMCIHVNLNKHIIIRKWFMVLIIYSLFLFWDSISLCIPD